MIYDVIIIGGGPAGSSAATFLAKNNFNVLVLEKERFPRDHVGESLIPFCYHKLESLGVLEEIKKVATYKPGVNFVDKNGERESIWCFKKVISHQSHLSFHCLRSTFDTILLKNAENNGANILEEQMVTEVKLDSPDGLVEVICLNDSTHRSSYKGKFLIDASGQGSVLAKNFNSKKSFKGLDRTAFFCHWVNNTYDYALTEGLIKILYLGGEKQGWIWVIPVGANHLSIGVTLNNSYVKERKKYLNKEQTQDWIKSIYLEQIEEAVALKPILKDASLEHEVLTMGNFSYYSEKKYGKNYAMIGDAGAFLDPIFSSGIYVAFESAHLVSKALIDSHLEDDKCQQNLKSCYETINGAYELLEKFVRLFYDSDTLHFAHIGSDTKEAFDGFKNAYETLHYLLAGDFFSKHKEYSQFIDELKSEKNFKRFLSFTKSKHQIREKEVSCGYNFKDIYGHLKA